MALGADSWLCKFAFLKILIDFWQILITCVFEKQTKKRLSLKTELNIELLLLFTSSRKVVEKMPRLLLGHTLIII